MNVLAQIIGFIALIFYIIGIQQNNKKTVLKLQILSNLVYAIQYILLSAASAACMNGVSIISSIKFYDDSIKNKQSSIYVFISLITLILICGVLTFEGYYSLIPIIMVGLFVYSIWQNNMTFYRIIAIAIALTYIIYNIIVGAYVAIIGSVIALVSAIIALIRFDIKK